MLRRAVLLLAFVVLLPAGTAAAAPPADLEIADARLTLRDGSDGSICLAVETPIGGDGGVGDYCDDPPDGSVRPPIVAGTDDIVAGVVPASGQRVELFFRGSERPVVVPTRPPSRYRGRRAVRVFLLRPPTVPPRRRGLTTGGFEDDGPYSVRVLDAAGALVAVYDDPSSRPYDAGPIIVQDGDAQLRLARGSELAPTPGEPEHRAPTVCLGTSQGTSTCAPADGEPSGTSIVVDCGGDRLQISLLLPPSARSAHIVMATGVRRRVRVSSLSAIGLRTRARLFDAPRGTALRTLELRGATGSERTVPLRLTPGLDCGAFGDLPSDLLPRDPNALAVGPGAEIDVADGRRLVVADAQDGRLCLRLPAGPASCSYLRPPGRYSLTPGQAEDGTTFFAVPAEVTEVETVFSDGRSRRSPTVAAGAYTGRYAETVRFALVAPPEGVEVVGVRLLAADGRFLGTTPVVEAPRLSRPARLLARLPGRVRLWSIRTASAGERSAPAVRRERLDCVVVGSGRPTRSDQCREIGAGAVPVVRIDVSCRTRRPTVVGRLGSGVRGLTARLRGGELRRARVVRAAGGRYAVLTLRPSERLALLRTTGRVRGERRILLPAGRAQCGYEAQTALVGPGDLP